MTNSTLRVFVLIIASLAVWACREPVPGAMPPVDEPTSDTIAVVDTTDDGGTSGQATHFCDGLLPWKFTPGDTSGGVLYGIRADSFCWVGSGRGGYLDQHPAGPKAYLQFSFDNYEFDRYLTEGVVFTDIAPRLCFTQELVPNAPLNLDSIPEGAMYTTSDDGDVLEDIYRLNHTARHFVFSHREP